MRYRPIAATVAALLVVPTAVLTSAATTAPPDLVLKAPVLSSVTPAANGWRPTLVKAVFSDVDSGPLQCRIDTTAWVECLDGVLANSVPLTAGTHVLRARLAYSDVVGPETAVTIKVDASVPTTTTKQGTRFSKSRAILASWSGKDGHSGVGTFQVRTRAFSPIASKAAWTYPAALKSTTKGSSRIIVARGATLCWSARARDKVGNWGSWSTQSCRAALIDERAVSRSAGWRKKSVKSAYLGTLMETKRDRAWFALPTTRAARVSVVVTTCPTCGTLDYYRSGRLITIIDLYSTKTKRGVVKTFITKANGKPVKVRFVAGTYGFLPVRVEGFGVSRY